MNARSAWLSPNGQTREDTRVAQTGAVTPATGIRGRSGIFPGSPDGAFRITGFALTGTTGRMTATVGVGRAVVQAEDSRGAYPVAVTEPITLTFGDGQEYARKDLVVLRIYDDQYDSSGRTQAVVEIVKGTASATDPTPPATPAAALPLYTVTVPANASAGNGGITWASAASVTDLRASVVAVGGILPTDNDSRTGAYPGQYRDTSNTLQRWNGTAWVAYPRDIGGIAPNGAIGNGGYVGQHRDGPSGLLQRWNGSAWVSYQQVPTWQDYTPVWYASSGVAPVVGNGNLLANYAKIGTVVHVRLRLQIGTTTNIAAQDAAATWSFSLPAPPVVGWMTDIVFNVVGFNSDGFKFLQGTCQLATNADGIGVATRFTTTLGASGIAWNKANPFPWVSGSVLSISGTYQSAS
ncbi:hypothetical protein ACOT81_18295 [Streptomyces sp. WI04-05B]|uniref:hypothetical protein n=1 Tax=Streptomyces TaxID=1883 RepID=UPI0029B0797C|nr:MULTISPECIES: hypothetical protein [unclassified Streptomyces]MDX2542663.1 hypothetical protein [Streptomyces sp. WI04-05B]MDX2582318.1 hypothetical protein [Streptomyces sp. WI04-05A]